MTKVLGIITGWLFMLSLTVIVVGQEPVCWWTFDTVIDNRVLDSKMMCKDTLLGYKKLAPGIKGNSLKLDGYSTRVFRKAAHSPGWSDDFSIEGWVALQALPWNLSAILCQDPAMAGEEGKVFFGIDASGYLVFKLTLDGEVFECISDQKVPLLQWNHVAATCDSDSLMTVFLNGRYAGSTHVQGAFANKDKSGILIGMNNKKLAPMGTERKASASIGSRMVLHGLIDELKIYDTILDAPSIAGIWNNNKVSDTPLRWEKLPSGLDSECREFGAYYTRLSYTEEWDARWPVADHPDIVVCFDTSPVRFIFWRGTGYGGVWVTENGIWMADQSLERVGTGKSPWGCSEHMSDKQTRYSHVRIVENHDARIVIHWRYAVADIRYNIYGIGDENPSGEWADEYYYIYPDGIIVRHQILHSNDLSHEWQETILINQAGTVPEDNVELGAITLLNMQGKSHVYSWENGGPVSFPEPRGANIQMVNLKSAYRPYLIFEEDPNVRPFNPGNIRPEYAHFPWWNHWPVAQIPNDGRKAFGQDRPSHSSLSQSLEGSGAVHANPEGYYEAMTLTGMTDQHATALVPLARSWNHSPAVFIHEPKHTGITYSKQERAFIVTTENSSISELSFTIPATAEAPLVHPAFIIKHWGVSEPAIQINSKSLLPDLEFRYGFRETLEGTDLVIWTHTVSEKSTTFRIVAQTSE